MKLLVLRKANLEGKMFWDAQPEWHHSGCLTFIYPDVSLGVISPQVESLLQWWKPERDFSGNLHLAPHLGNTEAATPGSDRSDHAAFILKVNVPGPNGDCA